MSITFQNLLTRYSHTHLSFKLKPPNLKTPNFDVTIYPHYQTLNTRVLIPFKSHSLHTRHHSSIRALESDGVVDKQYIVAMDTFDIDAFLSIAEFFCLASSAVLSVGFVINSTFSTSQKPVLEWFGNRVSVWQSLLLVVGIVIGAAIRRRQWRRICVGFSKPGSSRVNLVERIEKVEEDLRNSATIIRVLSRQLEKLGIRFRVTRKSMKEPIAQAAELAQKNSEATRALAVQEDILEKELVEIQKVLLAMQDQQQKQLELILAIAKTGKLWDNKPAPNQDQKKTEISNLTGGGSKSDGNR
ncbi:uncharacterized protein LOC112516917 [Cynara cardunculus var. scolymus]|uniref:Uncharacterized protein n=1 Tax=Cynara cardunculus var. scolymus TaxID=59895 RepID=A0A118K576_CYNCS|nr:uncharacterized protein LOC112516917 [Cynara cardunculus var. scolymus]KVI08582.1 hypothetical protein Ccrd_013048 [Cynara cardunculus var. scolymus]